jgi:hypothetical protein
MNSNGAPTSRLLLVSGFALILSELSRLPGHFVSYRDEHIPPGPGDIIAFTLTILFAVQLIRGRWLLGGLFFLIVFLSVEIWATLQMPVLMEGVPFRYPVFLWRLPFMAVHLLALGSVFFVRYVSNAKTRYA